MEKKQQTSKSQTGTMTAKFDAHTDYSKPSTTGTQSSTATQSTAKSQSGATDSKQKKQQSSKAQYGTMTAEMDANEDYE